MPGMNGGSSSQLILAAQKQQIGEADPGRTDVDDYRILIDGISGSSTSVYTRPDGPESSRATSAFMR